MKLLLEHISKLFSGNLTANSFHVFQPKICQIWATVLGVEIRLAGQILFQIASKGFPPYAGHFSLHQAL
jgi:hypothetical protein